MGQVVIGLFSLVILAIIALVILASPIRIPFPTETTPPPSTKPNPESSVSPKLNPLPTKQTSPTASLSPSPVQLPPDQNPCTAEQNGSTLNLGYLDRSCIFTGSVSSNNLENNYRFKIDNPSNISLFLDDVNSEVQMSLYSDRDGTGIIGNSYEYTSAFKSKSGIIFRELGMGSYIIVVKMKARDTQYSLQLVNNTSQSQEVRDLVDQKTISKEGSLRLKDRQHYYRFDLANPSMINLSLDGVNSEVEMSLYLDKYRTGVIGNSYEYTSAFKSKPGIIKRQLERGNYIVVVSLRARETNYNLTLSAP